MNIAVIGVGYVGLVSGVCFAELGNHVVCYDIDKKKIDTLKSGNVPISEQRLPEMLKSAVASGHLNFTDELSGALEGINVVMIAVGTPSNPDGSVDVQYVYAVADALGQSLQDGARCVVVTKSTVPVGTSKEISARIKECLRKRGVHATMSVVSNPEFLREGNAITDFLEPDRIVIGCEEPWAQHAMEQLYEPFIAKGVPVYRMDLASSEMAKYGANAMLACRISFMNEMSRLCEATGADIERVREVMASDKRIGPYFLQPGVGYGGSCFSKDVRAIAAKGKEKKLRLSLLPVIDVANDEQQQHFVNKILKAFHGDIKGKTFAVWGLAFKPNTTDMRSAPSIAVIRQLMDGGAVIRVFDPQAMDEARKIFHETIDYTDSAEQCLSDADALIVLTEWDEFSNPDWALLRSRLRNPYLFDGRNMYVPEWVAEHGVHYWSIGRKNSVPAEKPVKA